MDNLGLKCTKNWTGSAVSWYDNIKTVARGPCGAVQNKENWRKNRKILNPRKRDVDTLLPN